MYGGKVRYVSVWEAEQQQHILARPGNGCEEVEEEVRGETKQRLEEGLQQYRPGIV